MILHRAITLTNGPYLYCSLDSIRLVGCDVDSLRKVRNAIYHLREDPEYHDFVVQSGYLICISHTIGERCNVIIPSPEYEPVWFADREIPMTRTCKWLAGGLVHEARHAYDMYDPDVSQRRTPLEKRAESEELAYYARNGIAGLAPNEIQHVEMTKDSVRNRMRNEYAAIAPRSLAIYDQMLVELKMLGIVRSLCE